ncbi:MAG: glycosyltransferase family 39 protein [Acidobacteria bacterium]|nr:glycosyltransferase family 39 protein [Acidobacteriota bacterium]
MNLRERCPEQPPAWGILLAIAGAKLVLHLVLANRYGYFRDELYFLDCGRHLAWGYVDAAPAIGLYSRIALLLGGSLVVLRGFAALVGAAVVLLTGLLAWRLGGNRFAQGLAALAALSTPILLAVSSILSMNVFEPLFWTGAAFILVKIADGGSPRLWLLFGLVVGTGLLNKHSTAFFAIAVLAGVILSPLRQALLTRWPWAGAGLALLVFLPNLVWQATHGFPTLEDLRNVARIGKNVVLGPAEFVVTQILQQGPHLLPLWLGGLVFLLLAKTGRYRFLGVTFLVFFVLMFALKAKAYYLAPIYPLLLAAGATGFETLLDGSKTLARSLWPRRAAVAWVVLLPIPVAPLVLPILPPEQLVSWMETLHFQPKKTEVAHRGPLPQIFGDQFGWPELVANVAKVWNGLTPEERSRAAIFANNYGEAGAINLFGPRHGLPSAISAHQNHFFWGPRGFRGDVVVVLQSSRADLERVCSSVEEAGQHHHPWGMEEENGPIWVCRGLKTPLPELWPRLKHWN